MQRSADIRQLTGIRGVAALSVALVHLGFDRFAPIRFLEFHDQAVDLFFCLSGFTLSLVYLRGGVPLDFKKYFLARVARVYPLYLAVLVFCWWLTVRHLGGSGLYPTPLYIADTIRNLLMVNSWPVIGSGSNWDSPGWSLSVEAFCYIALFPALFAFNAQAAEWGETARIGVVTVLGFASLVAFSRFWDIQILVARVYTAADPVAYWIPLARGVTMFTAGWLMHGLWQAKGEVAAVAGRACDAISIAAFGILACAWLGILPKAALVLLVPALVLGIAANGRSVTSRFLAARAMVFLGEISYAVYLLHEPLEDFLRGRFPGLAARPVPFMAVALAALLLTATASYYGFEKPLRRLIKHASLRGR